MPGFKSRDPIPGTPGYVGESSQRHSEQTDYERGEIRANQRTPEPLMEGGGGGEYEDRGNGEDLAGDVGVSAGDGGGLEQKMQDETRHDAK